MGVFFSSPQSDEASMPSLKTFLEKPAVKQKLEILAADPDSRWSDVWKSMPGKVSNVEHMRKDLIQWHV